MTTALTKAIDRSRAFRNTTYSNGSLLYQGSKDFFDYGQTGNLQYLQNQQQEGSRRRYALFRGWVHAAINAIAKKGAGQGVNLGRLGKEQGTPKQTKKIVSRIKAAKEEVEVVYRHPFLESLEKPNSIQSRWPFVYSFICNLNLTGWAYVVADETDEGPQFYSLPTTWVHPIHEKGPFTQFRIANPNNPSSFYDSEPLDRSQVSFAYIPDPSNPMQALAPAQAQNIAIGIDDHIQRSQNVFFGNGIFPSIIITIGQEPQAVPGLSPRRPRLSGSQRRQLYSAVKKLTGGVANYGNPAIVDGLIEKFEPLSMNSQEMGWEKSEKVIRSRILSAFGVHPFILGEETAASYAQSWNVKDIFFENVNSYLDMLGSCMTHFARVMTGDKSLIVWWDPAEPIDPGLQISTYENARKRGDISQNEFRAFIGLPPDEDRNEDVLGSNTQSATTIAVRVQEGRMAPEQGQALLEGMGVPSSKAKDMAGKGPPPGAAPLILPGQPPAPGQQNLTPEQQQQQETRGRKPEGETEIERDIKSAIELLKKPIVVDLKRIEDQSEQIVNSKHR